MRIQYKKRSGCGTYMCTFVLKKASRNISKVEDNDALYSQFHKNLIGMQVIMKALKCKTLGASVMYNYMYIYTHIQGIRGQMRECTGSIRTIGKDKSSAATFDFYLSQVQ